MEGGLRALLACPEGTGPIHHRHHVGDLGRHPCHPHQLLAGGHEGIEDDGEGEVNVHQSHARTVCRG